MRVLLDTHALVWWWLDDRRLVPTARAVIHQAAELLVSAASAWEISTKTSLGKWPEARGVPDQMSRLMARQGMTALDMSLAHAVRAGQLPGPHRDPFDRMLIAQCHAEGLPLVSADEVFDGYGVRRIWSDRV